jgi:hypothetical protein
MYFSLSNGVFQKEGSIKMRNRGFFFLIALLLFLPSVVLANAGPTYEGESPGMDLMPIYNNQVKVIEENLTFDIVDNPDSFVPVKAEVLVNYHLENISEQEETLLLAFPFESSYRMAKSNISIVFDGDKVDYELFGSEVEDSLHEDNHQFFNYQGELTFSEMLSFMRQEAAEGIGDVKSENMKVILFELTFLPLSTHNLIVTYTTLPSLVTHGVHIPYLTKNPWHPIFVYYLEPAKYWADFENLTITIKTLDNFPIDDISIPGIDQVEPGYYVGTFDSLPLSNLVFSLINQDSIKRMERGEVIVKIVMYSILFLFLLLVFFIARKIYRVNFKKE